MKRNSINSGPPLGAVLTQDGIHFSLHSEHATAVDLCLFENSAAEKESQTLPLTKDSDAVWRVHVPHLKAGCLYGYRVHGPYRPSKGHRFNPAKLLIDPYAKALGRTMQSHEALRSALKETEDPHHAPPNTADSAPYAPLGKVVNTDFDWEDDHPPATPWEETLIYETHVKGMTQQHPDVPEELRGTYAGLASEPIIEHLTRLGITAVELLPVHQATDEYRLHKSGLTNYWGYNPLLWFAPDVRFAGGDTSDPIIEFKTMVRTFHRAGLEVILDMVFNHTAEGDIKGPTLSFRGIDNADYYRRDPKNSNRYADYTGCGNTFNLNHPRARQLVLDCLRYWVEEMHVDGFRLDLAVSVGRGKNPFDPQGEFFKNVEEDPVLSQVKWIAEPWDLGPGGYQLSNFPSGWSEWNDQYRQTVRRFWRGDAGLISSLVQRVSGSRDLFGDRPLHSSINYVIAHDGFTLQDLVMYEHKHNKANCENNRDGSDGNDSCNYGTEGPSDDPALNGKRDRQKKNMLATLLLSAGTPMISGGDEISRTQQGNNNAYCQDNPISWYDWDLDEGQNNFLEFTRSLIQFRKRTQCHLAARQWLRPDGQPLDSGEAPPLEGQAVACLLTPPSGNHPELWVLWNADEQAIEFQPPGETRCWEIIFNTRHPETPLMPTPGKPLKTLLLPGKSLLVLSAIAP